jgi:hypothetical protein
MPALKLTVTMTLLGVLWVSSAPAQTPAADQPTEQRMACTLQPVASTDEFVVVSVPMGETQVNVQLYPSTISSMMYLDVAPGQKPIDVLLIATSPTVFDFTGDVDRIRRVIVGPNPAAVRGVAADRIEFRDLHPCKLPYGRGHYGDQEREERWSALATMFGRVPDREIENPRGADRLGLPEGTIASKREEAQQARKHRSGAELQLYDRYPAGFRELDPATLVSPIKVLRPDTFPGNAGLMQLERRGDIRPATAEEITRWIDGASQPYRSKLSPNFRLTINFDYAVLRPVELPADTGRNYLYLDGVKNPVGEVKPPAGCIATMEGFRISDDEFCFREFQNIHALRELTATNDRGECRQLSAPVDASIEAVSVRTPKGSETLGSKDYKLLPIDVHVHKSGKVVLVLSSSGSAIWRVLPGPTTQIAGVLLMGYDPSTVEGLPADTPIATFDLDRSRKPPLIGSLCARFAAYADAFHGGGPAALLLDREVKALVGRGLDSLYGEYDAVAIDLP